MPTTSTTTTTTTTEKPIILVEKSVNPAFPSDYLPSLMQLNEISNEKSKGKRTFKGNEKVFFLQLRIKFLNVVPIP